MDRSEESLLYTDLLRNQCYIDSTAIHRVYYTTKLATDKSELTGAVSVHGSSFKHS